MKVKIIMIKKIENIFDIKKLIETIYNTYNSYKCNYYFSITIDRILLNNDNEIKNNIINIEKNNGNKEIKENMEIFQSNNSMKRKELGKQEEKMPGIEKLDADDDNLEYIKISGDEMAKYANESKDGIVLSLKRLFKEADEIKFGINYSYRKVFCSRIDKPDSSQLKEILRDTKIDDIYNQVKSKFGDFTFPEEGIQLVKTVGNINPDDITKHMEEAKKLYDKKDDDEFSSGTTVQCIRKTKTKKDGKKVIITYIKAMTKREKYYYRLKEGIDISDLRDVLEQIQEKGKPDGIDGVDYNKLKGDELSEVKTFFEGSVKKTYYYTTNVKGTGVDKFGRPYEDGKVYSITVISDPDNKTNKKYKVLDVFRNAEVANDKKYREKDKAKYYYIKLLGDKDNKEAQEPLIKAIGDTDIKDVYNKLKGDKINKSGMENKNDGVLLIKSKIEFKDKDLLNKIQRKLKENKQKTA